MLLEGLVLGAHVSQLVGENLLGVGVEHRLGGGGGQEHLALVLQHAHLGGHQLRKVAHRV